MDQSVTRLVDEVKEHESQYSQSVSIAQLDNISLLRMVSNCLAAQNP